MLANAATQGIGTAIGLQRSFNWKGVAAAGVGAAVGRAMGDALNQNLPPGMMGPTQPAFWSLGEAGAILRGSIAGFAGGVAAAGVKGGKVVVQQVAADAFGNALGQSLAEGASGVNNSSSYGYVNEIDRNSDNYNPSLQNTAQQSFRLGEIAEQNAQARSAALYGWSAGNDGLGFKPIDGISIPRMRYQGMVSDDLRTFSDSAAPKEIGPVRGEGDSPFNVSNVGWLLSPANPANPLNRLNSATGGTPGYSPIRPEGAGGPPPFDFVRERPSGAPGFAQANPSLGLGAPPQLVPEKSWFDKAIEGMPIGVKAAAALVQTITTKVGEAPPSDSNGAGVRAYPDGSVRTPDGKFASVAGMPAPGTVNASNYAEFLKNNGIDVVGTELEVTGPLGVRKYDIGTRNPDGTIFGIEIKSGGATKTWYQEITDMYVNQFGAAGRGRIEGQRVTGSMTIYLPPGGR
jgi:hypothetical protein